jgi:hypothetical protein
LAGVAKWLRQWVVVPPFVGSSPIIRPFKNLFFRLTKICIFVQFILCRVIEGLN